MARTTAEAHVADRPGVVTSLIVALRSRVAGLVACIVSRLRERVAEIRREPDAGYSTETVIVTALLAAAAIAVIGYIVVKLVAKAKSIDFG